MAALIGDCLEEWREELDPEVVDLIEAGRKLDAVAFKRQEILRTRQWQELARVFEDHDALLTPTNPMVAQPVERLESEYGKDDAKGRYVSTEMTMAFNFVPQAGKEWLKSDYAAWQKIKQLAPASNGVSTNGHS